jgi:ArsR family transcriptional regulator, lead/cadmium/zinc/bismuth-responsive transcriptional repressor
VPPAKRSGHRVIDGDRVSQAIAAIGPEAVIAARAKSFALLGDPTRLTLLTCIKAAGPISVSDLAAATGFHDATVSQTLRHLRAAAAVTAERDGRVIRYRLTGGPIAALLAWPGHESSGKGQLAAGPASPVSPGLLIMFLCLPASHTPGQIAGHMPCAEFRSGTGFPGVSLFWDEARVLPFRRVYPRRQQSARSAVP